MRTNTKYHQLLANIDQTLKMAEALELELLAHLLKMARVELAHQAGEAASSLPIVSKRAKVFQ
jgi:hypothetical protein